MNREDIIRMAREAGAMFDHMTWVERDLAPIFERFAAIAIAEEREACAKVCESLFDLNDDSCNEAEKCAAAIRARGKNDFNL